MSKSRFEISIAEGYHFTLASFAGNWQGTCKTWFEKDVLAGEAPITGHIEVILGGRFIRYTYNSILTDKPYEGTMIWGYDLGNDKCQCSWVDSFHMGTGIMLSEGTAIPDGFSVLGSYGGPGMPEPWGWRTELKFKGSDQLVLTAYNISPEGDEAMATESVFIRI